MAKSRGTQSDKRLLIIGWDGADWNILNVLMTQGYLPQLSSLVDEGASGLLESVIPSHSWAAWPTFLTGMDPAGHGVFDFVERDPSQPGRRVPVTSGSIKATSFLEHLSNAGREVRAGNIPVAYPPIKVKGRMISGVAVPPGAQCVYPPEWAEELDRRAPFPVNGLEWVNSENEPEALLQEARSLIEQRTSSFEVLLEGTWDAAACVYVEPDRLQHAFGAYVLPEHPDHAELSRTKLGESIREIYRLLDSCTRRLIEKAGHDTTVLLVSDHGFRPISRQLNLDGLLKHIGFASSARSAGATTALRRSSAAKLLKRTKLVNPLRQRVRMPSTLDWSQTRAYKATTGGGVSLNLKGREPQGTVEPEDYERVRSELSSALLGFVDSKTGEHPISETLPRETLYDGPYLHLAPDLFVRSNALWGLSTGGKNSALTSDISWPTGRHRRSGIVVARGSHIASGRLGTHYLHDVAPTALAFFGLRAESSDGHPIAEISGATGDEVTVQESGTRRTDDLTDEERQQIADHLRDLGYIE